MKRWLLAAACGAVAFGLLLYPLMGGFLNEKYHSDIETAYTAAIENTDDTELTSKPFLPSQVFSINENVISSSKIRIDGILFFFVSYTKITKN